MQVSSGKISEIFPWDAFLLCAVNKIFIEVSLLEETSPALKNSCCTLECWFIKICEENKKEQKYIS